MNDVRELRRLLGTHDPCSGTVMDDGRVSRAAEAAERMLAAAPADARVRRIRSPRRRWTTVAGAVTAAAALSGVLVLGTEAGTGPLAPPRAYAEEPAPLRVESVEPADATEPLLTLAESAETAEDAIAAADGGDVAYVRTSRMDLLMVNGGGDGPDSSGFVPAETESWYAPDGSYREAYRPEPPEDLRGDHEEHLEILDSGPEDRTYPAGSLLEGMRPEALPADPDEAAEAFARAPLNGGPGGEHDPEDLRVFMTGLDFYHDRLPMGPEERAAVLRALAERPEFRYVGRADDREGRSGLLFEASVESDGANPALRYRLLFDEDTGALLYREEQQNGENPIGERLSAFGLEPPVLTSYVTYLESGWTEDLESRP
ncbi:CU044_5270 family protein [Nocardiopsis halotolerans]|uniref:CU044_5270 family protein n=1 Tax=Nocardiopsis halotolerans TaxID=124252 RepID=UPI0003477B8D|nr:CU044_5270 family protein [Nocardiopsis halotolerans]